MSGADRRLAEGWREHAAGRVDEAEEVYREVLLHAPADSRAWCLLGMALHDQGRYVEGIDAYRQALAIDPHFSIAWSNLSNTLTRVGDPEQAITCCETALANAPDYAPALHNLGTAQVAAGRFVAARASFERALTLVPDNADSATNLALVQLTLGDYARGWPAYERRWDKSGVKRQQVAATSWDGSALSGCSLLLQHEQGLGDTLFGLRFAAIGALLGATVAVCVPPRLAGIAGWARGVTRVFRIDEALPQFDFWAPFLSMPYLLGLRVETIPAETGYLGVDPARLAVWRARLQAWPGFRVGIAWRGNPRATNDATRSAALADFLALANVPSVRLFSLQKGTGREELARLDARATVIDLADYLDDLADTAAAVCALDLVVAVDTALVHLAGGLGCPVWTALAVGPDWRWLLEREDTPWYPSMRLFRQRRLGDWTAVFARMAAELAMRTAVA